MNRKETRNEFYPILDTRHDKKKIIIIFFDLASEFEMSAEETL